MAHRLSERRHRYNRRQSELPPAHHRMHHSPGMAYSKSFDNLNKAINPQVARLRVDYPTHAPYSSPNSPIVPRKFGSVDLINDQSFRSLQNSPHLGRAGLANANGLNPNSLAPYHPRSTPGSRRASVSSNMSGSGPPPALSVPHTPISGRARKDSKTDLPPSSPPNKAESQSSSNAETNNNQTTDLLKEKPNQKQGKAPSEASRRTNATSRQGQQTSAMQRRVRTIFKYIFIIIFLAVVGYIIYILVTKLSPNNEAKSEKKRSLLRIIGESY